MFVVTELFNIAVNDFDAKKSTCYSRVLDKTELVVSGTQCTWFILLNKLGGEFLAKIFVTREKGINLSPPTEFFLRRHFLKLWSTA